MQSFGSRMTKDPVYDYPESCSPCRPVHGGSLKHVRVLDRLLLTQAVWLQLTVNSATALHILQREPPGTFLVRKSNTNQRKVLCVRLSDACSPSFVLHVYIREENSELSLEGSELSFPDLFRLISSYCSARDVLPHLLKLPEAIEKATSHKQLEAISHLGLEFWKSSLNIRDWKTTQEEPTRPDLPTLELTDCTTPQSQPSDPACFLKTRSPQELDCINANGALCFFNPLYLGDSAPTEGHLKRGRFKKSITVRVSTENSSPLSPPTNPPPPIPAEAIRRQRPGTVPLTRQPSEDQEYKQPKLTLRARLRKKLSKGSFDLGLQGVPSLTPTQEEDDYQVPRSVKIEQDQTLPPAERPTETHADPPENPEYMIHSRVLDTEELDFDSKQLPSLKELDSSSLSSLDEVGVDGPHKHASPQLQRKSASTSRRAKTPFRTVSEVFLSFLPPERKVLRAVEELAQDRNTAFGNLVQDFLTLIRGRRRVPQSCKATLQAVRQFMSQMKICLLEGSELNLPLQTMLPEADQEGVMEKAMYRCILKPLKRHLEYLLRHAFTEDGSLQQLQENFMLVRQKGPQAFDIRAALPSTQEVEKIRHKLVKMQKAYSPTDKVIILLQACKLMYNSMAAHTDDLYGADDFLPVMSYVLALCDLPELMLEGEYMMELLDPALLMGEGGYYLTSLYASLALLSGYHEQKPQKSEFSAEFQKTLTQWHRRRAGLPSFSDFQNFLRIGYQDTNNGCTSKTLVVRPSDTVEALCQLCAQKFKPSSQEGYGVFLYTGGVYQRLPADAHPQEIKSNLQSQEATFYFVYRQLEDEERCLEWKGMMDNEVRRTDEDKSSERTNTLCLLRRHTIDLEHGS